MQTNPEATNHRKSALCRTGCLVCKQREAEIAAARSLSQQFTAYDEPLERVEVFKYLGCLLAYNDVDVQAVRSNIRKALWCLAWISRVLRAENASPRTCGMFYKATVQAILLYGSETWNLISSALKRLEGFHIQAAWRMSCDNKPQREPNGTWKYPALDEVLEELGLQSILHYVEVRRNTIARFIVNRPIFGFCVGADRLRGSSPRQWWWEQSMDLDRARALVLDDAVVASDDEGSMDGTEFGE